VGGGDHAPLALTVQQIRSIIAALLNGVLKVHCPTQIRRHGEPAVEAKQGGEVLSLVDAAGSYEG
jgi:hypothetical protein